ncbi:formyltransferase family protein [Hoeflea poritis]|uniref:phosphoribosylglycinamide formyltransferase 1 n=1 Tax=Hoeflea poritis TaxID=2993659 RepID=A0ABT4VTF7_9HYPH|nr:formyltransferase family protein [Hoeflea poritis]MDA4847999.1 formyltransferase family protein [Hoeflea poritis]
MPNRFHALVVVENSLVSSAFVDAWLRSGNTVAALWTRDQKSLSSGTVQKVVSLASSVPTLQELVKKHKIPVVRNEPLRNTEESSGLLSGVQADTLITLMTHQIIPGWMIEAFGRRAVNVHPALLPHYKGPKPTLSLLADGQADRYGGITVHRLDTGIDTGAIIGQRKVPAVSGQNVDVWTYRIALAAADLARTDLQAYLKGDLEAVAQVPGSGNYRKCGRLEFSVEAQKTLEDVRRLLSMPAGMTLRAVIDPPIGRRDNFPIHRKISVISAPTGDNPRVTRFAIEMDIRDCRIRLLRKRKALSIFSNPAISIARYRLNQFRRGENQA